MTAPTIGTMKENLVELVHLLKQKRSAHRRGTTDYREWTDEIQKAKDLVSLLELIKDGTDDSGVKKMERDSEQWARRNPGAAARADALTSVSPMEIKIMKELLEGPMRHSRMSLRYQACYFRHLEQLSLIDYDGDNWNLTERGLEACEILK